GRLGAELLPRLGEGDEYPAVVFRVGCLGHEPAPLEFAEQTAERTAAHHQTAQQVALPDLRRGRRIDEHIELIGAEPMAGPELVFEPRHEVLLLLHHQAPGRDLDRAVLPDHAADGSRLFHLPVSPSRTAIRCVGRHFCCTVNKIVVQWYTWP